jgi:hypothetical protein
MPQTLSAFTVYDAGQRLPSHGGPGGSRSQHPQPEHARAVAASSVGIRLPQPLM